jgi:threonine/homoserine/homoserine lactone efflux protein
MFEPGRLALFVAASWALVVAPGPDMLYVITRGMSHGRRAGILSALGVIVGILVHTTAAALGLSVILQTSALAFMVIKFAGALYLLYLGVKTWFDKSAFQVHAVSSAANPGTLFGQGVLSNVLNPKVAIFFLAFLPQFVDRENGNVAVQMIALGMIFAFFGLCFLVTVGVCAGAIAKWLTHRPRYTHLLRRLASSILIILGIRLALTERS